MNISNKTLKITKSKNYSICIIPFLRYTYTSDLRFESVHLPHSSDWGLKIRYRMQDTVYRIMDTQYRIQDTEYRIQDTGYMI